MGFVVLNYSGSRVIFLVELNLYSTMANNSSSECAKCGVPHGSILGPLFLLYINDKCNVSKALDFILFADDTNIFSHNDPNQLLEIVNNELKKPSSCFRLISFLLT